MPPATPSRHISRGSETDPETPPSQYYLASEDTPTRPGPSRLDIAETPNFPIPEGDHPSGSTSSYESGTTFDDELEVLEDEDELEGVIFDHDEEDDAGRPLVSRRRRRRWDSSETKQETGLIELIPPLILAHPLPLLPLLATLPYYFLPGGVVIFVPVICVLAALSACAHIVIVYLAWYLKVHSFEEVFGSVTKSKYGTWAGRGAVMMSISGLIISWIGTLYPLIEPLIQTYLPDQQSPIIWTIALSTLILPSLLPLRINRKIAPTLLALCLPIVAFLVIGRTVEIKKAADEAEVFVKRSLGVSSGVGTGITTLITFFSPHTNTLSIHSHLDRNKRSSFPIPCLATSVCLLALSLPLALVPYYLLPNLPEGPGDSPAGVFTRLPLDDGWVNLARVLMCAIALGSCNMWILRGRDTVLAAMGVDRGERQRAGRWVGFAIWLMVVIFACIGGAVAGFLKLLGVLATLAVSWFLPSLFFIITFHVRSPLAIVFPSKHPPTEAEVNRSHSRTNSTNDPSMDVLLARKERQLQKRRTGRRLWQDLIVYVGILPVGGLGMLWTFGNLIGVW